jgi:hypothetical protein
MITLALQGGGMLGLGQTVALAELERRIKTKSGDLFTYIAGTSVGSIIGAGLATGVPASEVLNFFTQDAGNIFSGSILNTISQLWGSKYSTTNLELSLQKMLGDKTLADCKTKFLSTAFDTVTGRNVLFKSYEKSSVSGDGTVTIGYDDPIKLWQVCRASSAAQTYFPGYQYKGMVLIDGGNIGDNAPDILLYSELTLEEKALAYMLSIGSGNTKWTISPTGMLNPCVLMAAIRTITIVFAGGETNSTYLASRNLGDKYLRLEADLGQGFAIDDASKKTQDAMTQIWHAYITGPGKPILDKIIDLRYRAMLVHSPVPNPTLKRAKRQPK